MACAVHGAQTAPAQCFEDCVGPQVLARTNFVRIGADGRGIETLKGPGEQAGRTAASQRLGRFVWPVLAAFRATHEALITLKWGIPRSDRRDGEGRETYRSLPRSLPPRMLPNRESLRGSTRAGAA